MKVDLKEYLTKRDEFNELMHTPGPVITISRQYGCEATPIAQKLAQILTERSGKVGRKATWKIITKEILEDAAKELHLHPSKIEHVFTPHEKTFWEEMFKSFSHDHDVDDHKLHKTVKEIITNYSNKGHVIIVGRGGVAIARDLKNSVHIKLQAPLQWRIDGLVKREHFTPEHAEELAIKNDQRRALAIDHLREKKCDDSIYDLIINRVTMTENEIIETIYKLAESRHMFDF